MIDGQVARAPHPPLVGAAPELDLPFCGRNAVVTGSTSGIGEAIARLLAARGAHVIVSGRDARRGDEVVSSIRAAAGKADFVPADLAADAGAVREFAARAAAVAEDEVDILVNNAGIYPATPPAPRSPPRT